jgi:hypothetical protein
MWQPVLRILQQACCVCWRIHQIHSFIHCFHWMLIHQMLSTMWCTKILLWTRQKRTSGHMELNDFNFEQSCLYTLCISQSIFAAPALTRRVKRSLSLPGGCYLFCRINTEIDSSFWVALPLSITGLPLLSSLWRSRVKTGYNRRAGVGMAVQSGFGDADETSGSYCQDKKLYWKIGWKRSWL